MTDKEKRILEITQDLSDCLEYDIEDSSIVDTYDTACNLADKDWAKLPKDSVVLSREEIEEQISSEVLKRTYQEFDSLYKTAVREIAEKIFTELFYIASIYHSDVANILAWAKDKAKQLGVKIKEQI